MTTLQYISHIRAARALLERHAAADARADALARLAARWGAL